MRVAHLIVLAVAAAVNLPQLCLPDSCRVDSNCVDEIHEVDYPTKCCGGKCVRPDRNGNFATNKLIGDSCTPKGLFTYLPDSGESCAGTCGLGLFCSTSDEKCHALHGVGCPCTDPGECLSGTCRDFNASGNNEPPVCAGRNLVQGEPCLVSSECASRLCRDFKCAGIPVGEQCFVGGSACVTGSICLRLNVSWSRCEAPCGADVENCCTFDSECSRSPRGLVCTGRKCQRPLPVLPGLDEACFSTYASCNSPNLTCAYSCNETNGFECTGARVCQYRHQLPDGALCDRDANDQCLLGSSCESYYIPAFFRNQFNCTVNMPTPAPTPGMQLNSVPLGGICGNGNEDYDYCDQSQADMCQYNGTHYVCKKSGTTQIGEKCDWDNTRRNDECVAGSRCVRNGTYSNYLCLPPVQEGERCNVFGASLELTYPDYVYPSQYAQCASSRDNCKHTTPYSPCSCSEDTGNGPCCACLTPKIIPDGGVCNNTLQCKEDKSVCYSNRTCVKIEGMDCNSAADCKGGVPGQFDCSCDRKCYILNKPTPSPTTRAPTVPTKAPSYVYVAPPCDKQEKAWRSVPFAPDFDSLFPVTYSRFLQFVPRLLDAQLNSTEQTILIDLVCCTTCFGGGNIRFNTHIYGGYQVDCESKKLIKLEDTCNDLRNSLAFLNCWAVSPAPTVTISIGVILAMAAAFTS